MFICAPALATPHDARESGLQEHFTGSAGPQSSFVDAFEAQVWLMSMSTRLQPFVKDPAERERILLAVHREASAAKLPVDVVLSLIQVESHFNRFAISRVGAQGLMQVMPFWKHEIGRPEDNLTDIDTNIRYGCRILELYLKREKGDMTRALARYNGSVGKTWYPERVYAALYSRWMNGKV